MLRTAGLTKNFGGLTAVDDVDFRLREGELCSLIGPNGAGKTTFFDLLTGALEPTAGSIELRRDGEWESLTDADPAAVAQAGVHRSYQITNVFPERTVLENVRVAAQAAGENAWKGWRNANTFEEHIEEAHRILDRVGLDALADRPASALAHGEKRQLEVGIALAGDPDVLLLDEPNAGVSSESVDDIIDLIADVATDHAVLLVEHNMDIVMNVSDRIVVLNQGAVIADDEPAAVRDDPAVQRAYLGGYGVDDEAAPTTSGATSDTETDDDEEVAGA
ncbi:ABC transporter ATP-binding protein [Halolamina sediminis]|jgi:branched-chain amino acid transport system ATP-binding protein|uniref:ABC transporter ATP-binding protein n=1 Tax=Halolamina sediminis TaxID=1480675 RepID=UPI0006B6983A|nr:ABC transporter ATP-binding protein [Halolamina sediminis]